MRINKTCETCEFNVEGVCTGEGNYSYGQKIQDFNKECDGWGISFDYFTEITEKMPWYIKDAYDRGKIYFEDALRKLEEDETPKGTQINIYDAIAKVYNIPWWELGEILSWSAEDIADRLLARLTETEWRTYLEQYFKEEEDLQDYITNCNKMRKNWKNVIATYKLKELNITDVIAKRFVSI